MVDGHPMIRQWAIRTVTGDVFTYQGKVLAHDNLSELEFLFPGRKFTELGSSELPRMPLRDHPDMAPVRFPLRKEDFR